MLTRTGSIANAPAGHGVGPCLLPEAVLQRSPGAVPTPLLSSYPLIGGCLSEIEIVMARCVLLSVAPFLAFFSAPSQTGWVAASDMHSGTQSWSSRQSSAQARPAFWLLAECGEMLHHAGGWFARCSVLSSSRGHLCSYPSTGNSEQEECDWSGCKAAFYSSSP